MRRRADGTDAAASACRELLSEPCRHGCIEPGHGAAPPATAWSPAVSGARPRAAHIGMAIANAGAGSGHASLRARHRHGGLAWQPERSSLASASAVELSGSLDSSAGRHQRPWRCGCASRALCYFGALAASPAAPTLNTLRAPRHDQRLPQILATARSLPSVPATRDSPLTLAKTSVDSKPNSSPKAREK